MNTDWMHGLIDRLRETQHEQVRLLNHIVVQQERMIELLEMAAEPNARPQRTDAMKLLQPPYIWIILTLGALALQVPLPQAIEILKLGIGAQ